jgi:glyoxalase family protein
MEVSFSVVTGSLDYWKDRLSTHGVAVDATEIRFGERTLTFQDPHGLRLAIVETPLPRDVVPWEESPVPIARQLRGMHSVRLWERNAEATTALLQEKLGFAPLGEESGWHRYGVDGGGAGRVVDVKAMPGESRGFWGAGSIHHVAWRTKDVEESMAVRAGVEAAGLRPTPVIDRFWFQSIYFKEPGGVLFELATDGPGFDRDETRDRLGEQLILPPWLESQRAAIEASLPIVETPRTEPRP